MSISCSISPKNPLLFINVIHLSFNRMKLKFQNTEAWKIVSTQPNNFPQSIASTRAYECLLTQWRTKRAQCMALELSACMYSTTRLFYTKEALGPHITTSMKWSKPLRPGTNRVLWYEWLLVLMFLPLGVTRGRNAVLLEGPSRVSANANTLSQKLPGQCFTLG